ncbi:MAG: LytTR family DNA-binding domain-containing protein [Ferruginibacter sp.]
MKKIISALGQPYPYYNTNAKAPQNALFVFIFSFLFLILFRPFTVTDTEHKFSYSIICLVHALNAALVYLVFTFLFNKLAKPLVKEENWKVYKTILLTAAILFFIGAGSFLLRPFIYANPNNVSWRYFKAETINTFLIGTVIFGAFTLIDMYRLLKTNQTNVLAIEEKLRKSKTDVEEKGGIEPDFIKLNIDNEVFEIVLNEFLFAKAEGNYVIFYFNKNNSISKLLKRIALKNVEEQLLPQSPFFVKTHRAFLVNTKHIIKIDGNAQGYQLYFENIDLAVPVSRASIPAFKAVMKAI